MDVNKPDENILQEAGAVSSTSNSTSAWQRVGMNTVIGAAGGAIGGTVLATYRGHSVPFYATSMGTNYAIASLVFFGTETLIRKARGDRRDALGYAGAGLTTGVAITLPIGGRYQALVAGIAMAGVGYGGFYAHRRARAYLDELGREELRRRERESRERREKRQKRKQADRDSSNSGGGNAAERFQRQPR
eukprot:g6768.t1